MFFSASFSSLLEGVSLYRHVFLLYMVPAALYCLYNNLSFLSLAYFNPTTYFMFMQIRLLLTGLIYQVYIRISRKIASLQIGGRRNPVFVLLKV